MAGFKMHIGTSTVLGVAYGAAAFGLKYEPWPSCVVAAGLCSVAGMMPDLDSGPGRPLRESLAFAAAVVPMLMVDRFEHLGMSLELMTAVSGIIYVAIRFGLAWLLRHYTVHRGMFHSIPACAIAAELAFLVCGESEPLAIRYFKAGAVVLGFMSHLVLDEIYSVEFKYGLPHLKKSFGTAIKFWGDNMWANISCYAKLALLTYVVIQDPKWMNQLSPQFNQVEQTAAQHLQSTVR